MTPQEITAHLVEIRDEMIERPDGVSAFAMAARFVKDFPDAEGTIGPDLFRQWLHRRCRDLVKPPKSEQTPLPGLGEVPDVVTTYDAEGGFVYRRVRYASAADFRNNSAIHRANAVAADEAARVAEDMEALLVPVMEDHGFATGGQAIEHLSKGAMA